MRSLPFAALLLAPLTGCIVIEIPGDLSFESDSEFEAFGDDDWDDDFGGSLEGRGTVRGDLGGVRGFEGDTDSLSGTVDSSWSSVTVVAYDDDGRMGMIIVDVEGKDIRTLPSGTYVYGADGAVEIDGQGTNIYVTGCSSSDEESWDAPSEGGVIIVDNDGDDCDVNVEAELPAGDSVTTTTTVTASFTLE